MYEAESGDISIAVVGDAMLSRRLSVFREPEFLGLVDLLRGSDATLANLEFLFHDYESAWQWTGGTYTRSDPKNLAELKWLGIDGVFTANNHSFDFGDGGYFTTLRHLQEHAIPHAGGGPDLDHARAPGYVDTPRGRIALMSASSTFTEISRAGYGRPDFPGKPGINALRHDKEHAVTQDVFDALKKANRELGYEAADHARNTFGFIGTPKEHSPDAVDFLENKFKLSDRIQLSTSVNKDDLSGIENWIRGASRQADWLIYGLHCHESGTDGVYHGGSSTAPPDFQVEFSRWAIEQGCHMVAGHGPHFLRGIEIYKGRPIFYSLGNFIFQNESITWVPQEGYRRFGLDFTKTPGDFFDLRSGSGRRGFPADRVFWESVVPVCNYEKGALRDIQLYPIDLGFGRPIPQRGRPMRATGQRAEEILDTLRTLSEPMGTKISVENGVGVIRL
jgi:poly-gamma-glutamate synthesis protein (capsule biosynthesis protein)